MARRLLLTSFGWFALLATPAMAAPETSWAEAVQQGREASQAVLGRTGTETCLQGKMINALIEVSNRCDEGDGNPELCELAEANVLSGVQPLSVLDQVSSDFLKLTSAQP
tara:strand:+ start:1928 stop:2257 length:330 start_codon:yes stop_codon:yes gene_type:complete